MDHLYISKGKRTEKSKCQQESPNYINIVFCIMHLPNVKQRVPSVARRFMSALLLSFRIFPRNEACTLAFGSFHSNSVRNLLHVVHIRHFQTNPQSKMVALPSNMNFWMGFYMAILPCFTEKCFFYPAPSSRFFRCPVPTSAALGQAQGAAKAPVA